MGLVKNLEVQLVSIKTKSLFFCLGSPEMAVTQLKPTEKRMTMWSGEMLFSGERGLVMSFWKNLRESGHF